MGSVLGQAGARVLVRGLFGDLFAGLGGAIAIVGHEIHLLVRMLDEGPPYGW